MTIRQTADQLIPELAEHQRRLLIIGAVGGAVSAIGLLLNPAQFLRIHRSTIVNIERIKEIQAWFHGHHRVLLENGTELRMSRYQHEIARKLGLG